MHKISRRGLFGLGAGAAAAPFVKPESPTETGPMVTVFHASGTFKKPETITIVTVGTGGGGGGGMEIKKS